MMLVVVFSRHADVGGGFLKVCQGPLQSAPYCRGPINSWLVLRASVAPHHEGAAAPAAPVAALQHQHYYIA